MKRLYALLTCLLALPIVAAAQTPSKFAGRWVGVSSYGSYNNQKPQDPRVIIILEVDPNGVIFTGQISDFSAWPVATISGQFSANGKLSTQVEPLGGHPPHGELKITLGQTTGTGTFKTTLPDQRKFRSTFRFWREEKPTRNGEETHSVSVQYLDPVGSMPTNIIVLPIPAAPAAPNP
jgi:hypothetical protein